MSKIIIMTSLVILAAVALPRVQSRVLVEEVPKHSLAELNSENSAASGFQQMLAKVEGTNDTKQRDKRMNSQNGCIQATICLDPNSLRNVMAGGMSNDFGSASDSFENSGPVYGPSYGPGQSAGQHCYSVDLHQCENGKSSLCFSEPLNFQSHVQSVGHLGGEADPYPSQQFNYQRPVPFNQQQVYYAHRPANYGSQSFMPVHTGKFSSQTLANYGGSDAAASVLAPPPPPPYPSYPIQNQYGHSRECAVWGQSHGQLSGDAYCTCKKKRSASISDN